MFNERDGIYIAHFGTAGSNVLSSAYTTAGSGTNNIAAIDNTYVEGNSNWCVNTNLELVGLADVSGLSSTITAYSDGYKAVSTM